MLKKKFFIVFISVLIVGILTMLVSKIVLNELYPQKYEDLVQKYATEYGISENLLFAIIKTESGFNENAKSGAGALGLTQITEDTFNWLLTKTGEEYAFEDLKNPEISIKYGALFISMLIDEFENTDTAIAAYHAGRGQVNAWLQDPSVSSNGKTLDDIPIAATAHYVYKVNRAINIYENLYN